MEKQSPDEQLYQDTLEDVTKAIMVVTAPVESKITEMSSMKDLYLDSLDILEVVMELEEKFDISFPDDALAFRTTVQEIVHFIMNKRNSES